jgi:hypothetical protein
MAQYEIPLLRCSATYARRLIESSLVFAESKYQFYRRVNWSYRYSLLFHANESSCFRANPQAYIEGQPECRPELEDVYEVRLQIKQVAMVILKVLAHWIFYLCGCAFNDLFKKEAAKIYRKAYVDDIELVFESDQPGVVRAVYPFPLNIARQWRYFRFLRKKGYPFKTDGNPYSPIDLLNFLLKRDVRSLQRMESRAQVRHAYEVAALGVEMIQLSDEFDVGSLDFCRAIRRHPIRIINSAHGVGTYLPVHAYHEFHVLTQRQQKYYMAIHDCEYKLRTLNSKVSENIAPILDDNSILIRLVFLSQTSSTVTKVVLDNEVRVVQRLASEFAASPHVKLLYRAHPNNSSLVVPDGFESLGNVDEVNGQPGTIYVSFFSTCYIDPTFKGIKILLRGDLIYPELIFDELGDIFDLDGLMHFVRQISRDLRGGARQSHLSSTATNF